MIIMNGLDTIEISTIWVSNNTIHYLIFDYGYSIALVSFRRKNAQSQRLYGGYRSTHGTSKVGDGASEENGVCEWRKQADFEKIK